jgi:hypothetical protein
LCDESCELWDREADDYDPAQENACMAPAWHFREVGGAVTDLDAFAIGQPGPPTPSGARRKAHRHVWGQFALPGETWTVGGPPRCLSCGTIRDEARSRRGRSARRLGGDQERRARDRYGFEKVGQYGGITDLRGATKKVQQKASRRPAPPRWQGIFRALDAVADGRTPAILLSFVRAGVGTEDFFVIRGSDWLDLFGRDEGETP